MGSGCSRWCVREEIRDHKLGLKDIRDLFKVEHGEVGECCEVWDGATLLVVGAVHHTRDPG